MLSTALLQKMTPATSPRPAHLIIRRLHIEALLHQLGIANSAISGRLVIDSTFGDVSVAIEDTGGAGGRIELGFTEGICPEPSPALGDYLSTIHGRNRGICVERDDEGSIRLTWRHEFEGRIAADTLAQGLAYFAAAHIELSKELKEQFFIQTSGRGLLNREEIE